MVRVAHSGLLQRHAGLRQLQRVPAGNVSALPSALPSQFRAHRRMSLACMQLRHLIGFSADVSCVRGRVSCRLQHGRLRQHLAIAVLVPPCASIVSVAPRAAELKLGCALVQGYGGTVPTGCTKCGLGFYKSSLALTTCTKCPMCGSGVARGYSFIAVHSNAVERMAT